MKPTELIRRAQRMIGDKNFDGEMYEWLNKGIRAVITAPAPNIVLPELETSGTVTTDTNNNVSMPSDYLKNPFLCFNSDGEEIEILITLQDLLRKYEGNIDSDTTVNDVAVVGSTIYYQGVPSTAETLTIHYTKEPDVISRYLDTNITLMPDYLQEDILSNYIAYMAGVEMGNPEIIQIRRTFFIAGVDELAKQYSNASRRFPTGAAMSHI